MKKIEDRPLSKIEINLLLAEAPELETRNLINFLKNSNEDAFNFFSTNSVYRFGLIIDNRPIYFAYITNFDNKYELWTVVNSGVLEQFSLYKYSKRSLKNALKDFSPIYATMEKHNKKNLAWVKSLGFKAIDEDDLLITFMIQKPKE